MQAMKRRISEETSLAEVMRRPETLQVLVNHGIPCVACPMARFEMESLRVGDVAKAYGIDVDRLMKDLNEALEKAEK